MKLSRTHYIFECPTCNGSGLDGIDPCPTCADSILPSGCLVVYEPSSFDDELTEEIDQWLDCCHDDNWGPLAGLLSRALWRIRDLEKKLEPETD